MLGHKWEPAEGVCVDIRVKPHGNEGTDNRRWLMEIHCGDAEPFRVELGYPGFHDNFRGPGHGQTCRMEADVHRKEAKWDLSDPALSWKTDYKQHEAKFAQEKQAPASSFHAAASASPPPHVPSHGEPSERLTQLQALLDQGAITPAEYEEQRQRIIASI
jgi:Short C-terminal domain